MKQDQTVPSPAGVIILFLLFINAALIKDNYIAHRSQHWVLYLSLPLLILALLINTRIKKPDHKKQLNNAFGHDGCD